MRENKIETNIKHHVTYVVQLLGFELNIKAIKKDERTRGDGHKFEKCSSPLVDVSNNEVIG